MVLDEGLPSVWVGLLNPLDDIGWEESEVSIVAGSVFFCIEPAICR